MANSNGTGQRRLVTVINSFSDWSPDGRRIAFDFVDDAGMRVASISPHGGSPQQITFGSGIQEVPKWSPDGQLIVFDASPVFPDDPTFHISIWLIRSDGTGAHQVTHDCFDIEFGPRPARH